MRTDLMTKTSSRLLDWQGNDTNDRVVHGPWPAGQREEALHNRRSG